MDMFTSYGHIIKKPKLNHRFFDDFRPVHVPLSIVMKSSQMSTIHGPVVKTAIYLLSLMMLAKYGLQHCITKRRKSCRIRANHLDIQITS